MFTQAHHYVTSARLSDDAAAVVYVSVIGLLLSFIAGRGFGVDFGAILLAG
jgi:hypothetical protein